MDEKKATTFSGRALVSVLTAAGFLALALTGVVGDPENGGPMLEPPVRDQAFDPLDSGLVQIRGRFVE